MTSRTNRYITLLIFALSIVGFWWLQQTTLERIGSLCFFVLVSFYALYTHRDDVPAGAAVFFATVDINQYLFNSVLPIWLGIIGILILMFLLWYLLFGRSGWFLAVASALVVIEVVMTNQYINIEPKLQALLIVTPFILASQYYYFSRLPFSDQSE
jgi:hypothetical protein